jgi:hypothetical protein
MDQEMMQLKHELKEFIEHGQHILQKMDGSMGQRYYGMRGSQGGYSNGGYSGGNVGQREHWSQGGYPQQGMYPQQEQWPNIDPRIFM